MRDCVDDLLRDTDDDDPDLSDLIAERIERLKLLNSLTYTERLAPPGGPQSCRETGSPAIRVLILEDDPATQEVFSLLLAPEEGFEVACVSEVEMCVSACGRRASGVTI
ncbi:MAG: hypothetical protein ACLQUY_26380 [Ktedonobacterales bacterium]